MRLKTRGVAGVSDHLGWAVVVCVGVNGGSPEVLDRRRIELVESGLPAQPYEHDTVGMNARDGERLAREVRESAMLCAERALSRLRASVGIDSIALRAAPLAKLPATVAEVHASWHLRARADAMLYHDALCQAAASLGIEVAVFKKGSEVVDGVTAAALDGFLRGLRVKLGVPWQQDHRAAAARAIAMLGRRTPLTIS